MDEVPQDSRGKRPGQFKCCALTPQGKCFTPDETRFPAYETRLKQRACIIPLGSVLTKSLPWAFPQTPALGVDLLRTIRR
jgi:hypothetical protein